MHSYTQASVYISARTKSTPAGAVDHASAEATTKLNQVLFFNENKKKSPTLRSFSLGGTQEEEAMEKRV
jgi:hypothetical protein